MSDARAVAYVGRIEAVLHPETEKKEEKRSSEKKVPVSKAPEPIKPVALGFAALGQDMDVVDSIGETVRTGQVGELVCRRPWVAASCPWYAAGNIEPV